MTSAGGTLGGRPTETARERAKLGRFATGPWNIPIRGWWEVLRRVAGSASNDEISQAAAAVAFYAFLSLVPALIALVSSYALIANPHDLSRLLGELDGTAPSHVLALLEQQLSEIIAGSATQLTLGVLVSLLVAWLSASRGVAAMMRAVNIAYREEETRGWLTRRWLAVRLSAGLSVFVAVAIAFITILPTLVGFLGLEPLVPLVRRMRWPFLAIAVMFGLGIFYRYAPNRTAPKWRWVLLGAALATAAWLLASMGLAYYVDSFGNFNATYGALGAIAALLLWFFVSAYAILFGAELNAELEHQTEVDTTVGPPRPMGRRAAAVADSVGPTLPSESWSETFKGMVRSARGCRRHKE
ncbi:MAG: YihY/virulence factor BrkB family protein [Myxococcales bacterium]|jgi:membrane protein|nr:YihY/virulence factor BrkB family protein [Myxococcales bacterium]